MFDQVPQFLMDQYVHPAAVGNDMANGGVRDRVSPFNIVCTQPRRISAIGECHYPLLSSAALDDRICLVEIVVHDRCLVCDLSLKSSGFLKARVLTISFEFSGEENGRGSEVFLYFFQGKKRSCATCRI